MRQVLETSSRYMDEVVFMSTVAFKQKQRGQTVNRMQDGAVRGPNHVQVHATKHLDAKTVAADRERYLAGSTAARGRQPSLGVGFDELLKSWVAVQRLHRRLVQRGGRSRRCVQASCTRVQRQ